MKRLTQICSLHSTFIGYLVINAFFCLLFRPVLIEFILLTLIDLAAMIVIMGPREKKLFLKIYPEFRKCFPFVEIEQLGGLSLEEKVQHYNSMVSYPKKRIYYLMLLSIPKVIPGAIFILFGVHRIIPFYLHFLKYLAFQILILSFYFSVAYIEFHVLISNGLRELHQRFNWTGAFLKVNLGSNEEEFNAQENIGLFAVGISFSFIFILFGLSPDLLSSPYLPLQIFFNCVICFLAIGRLYFLYRNYLVGGLRNIQHFLENLDWERGQNEFAVPLHSSGLLAKYEQTLNCIYHRLLNYKEELFLWILRETEQNRYKAMGEMSGLIIHDLVGPLNTISLCVDELKNRTQTEENRKFFYHMQVSVNQSLQLISSFRSFLKNPDDQELQSDFVSCHRQVLLVLNTEFRGAIFHKLRINIDPGLKDIKVKMGRVNLMHILYNLYKNSITDFLNNSIENPVILVGILEQDQSSISLCISDNGSGLSVQEFEKMTSMNSLTVKDEIFKKGLGLRLICRLVERYNGELKVKENEPSDLEGTSFILTLLKGEEENKFFHNVNLEKIERPQDTLN